MIVEHERMRIDPAYRAALTEAGLSSVTAVLGTLGDRLAAWSRTTDTVYISLPRSNLAVFLKRYHYPRWSSRMRLAFRGTLVQSSRAKSEYRVLAAMRRWGIQAVRPIAWGEQRLYGLVRSCFLITEAVPDAMSLATFIHRYGPGIARDAAGDVGRAGAAREPKLGLPEWAAIEAKRSILINLARQVRFMHDAGFVHRDLFWRNVLIRPLPNREFEFYFLDASVGRRIRVRQWRRESIVRDLAALGVMAPEFCSRADQLRFIRNYLGTDQIGDQERQWLEAVQERSKELRASEEQRMERQGVFDRMDASAA